MIWNEEHERLKSHYGETERGLEGSFVMQKTLGMHRTRRGRIEKN